ncbi:alpha/beta hydrolase family protein [Pedobacter sp. AW1-32]|uniref:alpha/beta hydrolase family protein n=1 Tax=Pedobacter sp. AW1-32 TaxID=3383026 RepID=UPI003FEFDEE5
MKGYFLLCFNFLSITLFAQKETKSDFQGSYSMQNVSFVRDGTTLAGTIFTPKNPGAAVVLVHGSGQEKRMVNFAATLARAGIAVFTYDKRGVGESTGKYSGPEVGTNNIDSANLNTLALDASAAVNFLSSHLRIKKIPIGLLGFSQAGWIIPLAAEQNNRIEYMVLFSGPVVNTLQQLRFQFYTQGNSKFWETHTERDAREHVQNDPDRFVFTPVDPNLSLANLSIPGIWIFGGQDIQIPTGLSIENLNLLKSKGKNYQYLMFPELGHNTSSPKSAEPIGTAIRWMINRSK